MHACVASCMQVPAGAKVIDARGMFVMPGGVDPHAHLDENLFNLQSQDDFFR